ncbi:hypothetical protein [Mucilaginibacter paludis]|uniref:TerB family tellurite resistance protein n=1 Tax=Mucilaginibacter paludis DSM 18603 TaxID=714943 RepID=H1YEB0_9SPHI|nr:hypothetical protein [Mucilaginibacter paludis]EHQ26173.1 hypothetical protein Mucpa_2033 [Mucilaginibacter paludis DSM 18603]
MRSIKKYGYCLCVLALVCCSSLSRAQTFAEWFKQTSTQKKYLLQQIAALQVYTGFLEKGYTIAKSGLGTIKDITSGEFDLHSLYISSLKRVNPVIRNDKRVDRILSMQTELLKRFNELDGLDVLPADNKSYIGSVKQTITDLCRKDLDELELVIISGKLEMTDDERLERLGKVYESTLDKYAFTQQFTAGVTLLVIQVRQQQSDTQNVRRYYENN